MARVAEEFRSSYAIPGLSVAISRNGNLVYVEAFGVADSQTGERLTPGHRFRIASVSKSITSVTIFRLIEQGRLRLGDRVFGPGRSWATVSGRHRPGRALTRSPSTIC